MLLAPSTGLYAQESSAVLAEKWRAAKRAELAAQRARLDLEIAGLDRATPDATSAKVTPAPTNVPAPAAPLKLAPSPSPVPTPTPSPTPAAGTKFGGLEFGIGLSYTGDLGNRKRVGEAADVGGVVRIRDENNGNARIMLESHYFFTPCGSPLGLKGLRFNSCSQPLYDPRTGNTRYVPSDDDPEPQWGWGPFVALQPSGGDGKLIDAIGMGVMTGFRRGKSTQSFNFGAGFVMDLNVKVLGDGVFENKPLPAGEETVRLKETTQTGFLLISSFSF